MTRIVYGDYDDRFFFEATGHAVSEELSVGCGCDGMENNAVCAAISILVLTAQQRLCELDELGMLLHFNSSVESGYACFDVTPRIEETENVMRTFEILMTGFALLEESYPDLICCE